MAKTGTGFSIYKLFGKIGDILFIPVVFLALFTSFAMLIKKQDQKPMSVFGYSIAGVLSESMLNDGFLKGDLLLIEEADYDEIKLGDVIAFYNYRDPNDTMEKKHILKYNYNGGFELNTSQDNILYGVNRNDYPFKPRTYAKTLDNAIDAKASIYFHRVIGIYVDITYGNVFYQTKGSNNASPDEMVRSDFVVGKYVNTPRVFRDIMGFCASSRGMIILICIPLSLLVLTQSFSLIRQIEVIGYEKQLVRGKKKFNDPDVQKDLNGNELELYNKVYLYYITKPEERRAIKYFMWSELLADVKLSKKQKNELKLLTKAEEVIKTSNNKYWQEWINNTSGYTRKKIKAHYENLATNIFSDKNKKEQNSLVKTSVNKENKYRDQTLEETQQIISRVTGKGPLRETKIITPQIKGEQKIALKADEAPKQKTIKTLTQIPVVQKTATIAKTSNTLQTRRNKNAAQTDGKPNNIKSERIPHSRTVIVSQKTVVANKRTSETLTTNQMQKKAETTTKQQPLKKRATQPKNN